MLTDRQIADELMRHPRYQRWAGKRWYQFWRKPVEIAPDWVADIIAKHRCVRDSGDVWPSGDAAYCEAIADGMDYGGYVAEKSESYNLDPATVLALIQIVVRLWLWWQRRNASG